MPASAFIPLLILLQGLGEDEKLTVIWIGVFFPLALMVVDTAHRVPIEMLHTAYTLGASRWAVLRKVLLPAMLPDVVDILRITMGWAWTYLIVAELVAATAGIGYFILVAQRYLRSDRIIAAILTIGALGPGLVSQYHGRLPGDTYEEMLEQTAVAEASGFDAVFVSEHHPAPNAGDYCFQPVPVLAALASGTRRIGLGTSVLLLPLYQPWRLAEELLTLQAASQGRLILCVGAGFDAREFEAFGLEFSTRFKRLEASIRPPPGGMGRVRRSLSRDAATRRVGGGHDAPLAIRRAARLGDAWLPADTARLDALKEAQDLYAQAMRARGKNPSTVERPLMREAFVHEEAATARCRLASPVVSRYRAYWGAGDIQLRAEFPHGDFRYADLEPGRFIVGDPVQCIRLIEELRRELGTTFLILRIPKPELSQAVTLEAIRMFVECVIPRFRASEQKQGKDRGGPVRPRALMPFDPGGPNDPGGTTPGLSGGKPCN